MLSILKKRSVILKIALILLFMSLTTVIVSMVGISKLHEMNQVANDIFFSNSSVLYPLSDLLELIYKVEHITSRAVNGDSSAISELSAQLSNVTGQIGNFDSFLTEEELSSVQVISDKYKKSLQEIYNELRNNGPLVSSLYHDTQENSLNLYNKLYDLGKKQRIQGLNTYNKGKIIYSSVIQIQTWITFIGVFIAIIIGVVVAISIITPLNKLRNASDLLAQGDLRAAVNIKSNDEVGAVARAFNRALTELRLMVTESATNAKNITSSSNELFRVTDETSRSLGELNKLVEELANSATTQTQAVDSATKLVQKATEGAESVTNASIVINNTCSEASVAAERGGEAAVEMTHIINSFVDTVNSINNMVQDLAEDSKAVQDLVDVIRDIFEKTSLLSLNASIEAARAKEHGKGFAVVASSIRQLSIQSRESVEHIDEVISKIFDKITRAVTTIEIETIEVDKGRKTLMEAANLFKELVRQVNQIIASISHITNTANQLGKSSQEVINEMTIVSQISQDNLAAVEEVSASFQEQYASTMVVTEAARQLQTTAEKLSTSAEKFKI